MKHERSMLVHFKLFKSLKPNKQYTQARRRLMETFKGMIACRRTGSRHPEDFLQSMLQRDQYPDNEKLSDEEIMDNLLTLIIAGQTTTAAAMMWSVKFLDEHQGVQDRLRVRINACILKCKLPLSLSLSLNSPPTILLLNSC